MDNDLQLISSEVVLLEYQTHQNDILPFWKKETPEIHQGVKVNVSFLRSKSSMQITTYLRVLYKPLPTTRIWQKDKTSAPYTVLTAGCKDQGAVRRLQRYNIYRETNKKPFSAPYVLCVRDNLRETKENPSWGSLEWHSRNEQFHTEWWKDFRCFPTVLAAGDLHSASWRTEACGAQCKRCEAVPRGNAGLVPRQLS